MKFPIAWLLALVVAPLLCVAQGAPSDGGLIVEDLQCRGNVTTSCSFILGHLYLNPSDVLDEEEIQNARLRLASLQNFDSVDIYLEKGSQKGRAIVIVEVREADPITTEWAAGTSARLDGMGQVLAGRVIHQNLLGEGKLLDFTAVGVIPIERPTQQGITALLRYADPHLFDTKRYFAITSLLYENRRHENKYGSFGDTERLRLGLGVGRRLWDFSYVSLGYAHQVLLDARSGQWRKDGTFELKTARDRHALDLSYGWNSEDDFYFPTRGSGFHLNLGWDFGSDDPSAGISISALQFRKTWQTGGGSFWTFKFGGDPAREYRVSFNDSQTIAVAYARPLVQGFADIRRGRWYVELGYGGVGYKPDGSDIIETGVKAGVRLESKSFGLVDLYVIASHSGKLVLRL